VDDERVPRPVGVEDADQGRQPGHVHHGGTDSQAGDVDVVVAVGAVGDDGGGLPVAGAGGGPEGQVDHAHAGAGQVVDGDGVGPAQGEDVDPLQAVQVHRHPAEVTGEPRLRAVRPEGDALVLVVAAERQQVRTGLPVAGVAAI